MRWRLWWFAALVAVGSGCADTCTLPRIDPSGDHVFATAPVTPQNTPYASTLPGAVYNTQPQPVASAGDYRNTPGQLAEGDDVSVSLTPPDTVAQVGSEVILVAGVGGADGFLKAHRRLEWTISPGGVGQFTDIGKAEWGGRLLGDDNPHQIVSATYAVGSTQHNNERLTRGTPDPADDVYITTGQGWVSLTSPVEGDSIVTVVAPTVYGWECRHKSATIHWLDVNWRFPSPAINSVGSKQSLSTTITKHTTQSPNAGWLVRYTIASGPPAGFSPDGATSIEVPANAAGQANAEIFQKTPTAGTNQINIEVIRPGTLPGADGKKIIIGRGSTMATWTSAVIPGKTAADSSSAGGTVLNGAAPGGTSPGGTVLGGATGAGPETGGKPVAATTIDLKVSEPPPTPIGGKARFNITITNYGSQPTGKLRLYDAFEPGLQFRSPTQQNHVDLEVGVLRPMLQNTYPLEFTVMQAGMLSHTVKVLDENGKTLASRKAFVKGEGPGGTGNEPGGPSGSRPAEKYGQPAGGGTAGTQPGGQGTLPGGQGLPLGGQGTLPGGQGVPPVGPSELSIKVTGPAAKLTVRELASFSIEITNTGTRKLTNLRVEAYLSPSLERAKAKASKGFWHDNGVLKFIQRELPPKEKLILDIQSECLQPDTQAAAFVQIISAEGAQAQGEARCEIVAAATLPENKLPAESKLQLTASCPTNPARVGKQFNCLVTVANSGTEEERNVVLEVVVPDGLTIVPFGTTGPTKEAIEKQTVRFGPIPSLPPGQRTKPYRILVQTKKPGSYTFTAGVKSDKQLMPILQNAPVDVTQ